MTEADYRALTEDTSRSVEIVHGHAIKRESPVPPHNRIARRLCFALESARSPSDPCLTIETAADVVLWRVPRFTLRRPDVVVHECRDDPVRKPTAQETVLVVEVAANSSDIGTSHRLSKICSHVQERSHAEDTMADRDSSENPRHGTTVEAKLQRLLAAGVIGPSSTDTRPVASGQTRPRPRRAVADLLSEQRG
jgi:hypothetical protein